MGLRADDPRPNDPCRWRGKNLLGEALFAVRETIRDSETGPAHPVSSSRFRFRTGNAGIHENSTAMRPGPFTAASARKGPPSEFSTYFSDAPADQSREGLEIASGVGPGLALSEHGPCLVVGTVTLDDASCTTKIATRSGGDAITPYRCVALLDTVPPKSSSNAMCWTVCFRWAPPRRRASGPAALAHGVTLANRILLRTSTSIRLSVQFFRNNEPTISLAAWACVVPPSVIIQHAVLLGYDSWMCFSTRSYRALHLRPRNKRVFGAPMLSNHVTTSVSIYTVDPIAKGGDFRLLYDGPAGVTLSDGPQLLEVILVRSNGSPALTGQ